MSKTSSTRYKQWPPLILRRTTLSVLALDFTAVTPIVPSTTTAWPMAPSSDSLALPACSTTRPYLLATGQRKSRVNSPQNRPYTTKVCAPIWPMDSTLTRMFLRSTSSAPPVFGKSILVLMDYILTRPPVNAGCKSRQNSTLGWSSEPNRPPAALFFSPRPTRRLSVTSPIGLDFGQGTVDTYQSILILPFAHTLFMPLQSLTTNSSSPLQVDLSLTLMPATTDALWRLP